MDVEAPCRDVISILQAETWQCGYFPKGAQPVESKAATRTLHASGQAQLLHIWELPGCWLQVGHRGKGSALGSCCWARAVLSYPSLSVWSRGRSSSCMPVTAWLELAKLTEMEGFPGQTVWRFSLSSLSFLYALYNFFMLFNSCNALPF